MVVAAPIILPLNVETPATDKVDVETLSVPPAPAEIPVKLEPSPTNDVAVIIPVKRISLVA